ncbi:MAG: ATP-binding protein [Bacteroidota bacterium]
MSSPFKFLDAYEKKDRDIYFGREKETEQLYEKLFETNLLLLYGASGTGKSSLINCGLCNRFQAEDWFSLFVRREENIMDSLWRHIEQKSLTPISEGMNVPEAIRSLYLDHYKPIYLIFDQFEEIFIEGKTEEQYQFFHTLQEILTANLQCKVILSMREEYLGHLYDFENIIPQLYEHRFRVERMKKDALERVISGTLKAFGIEVIDPDTTISAILNNLRDKKKGIDLTNLQVYLDRLHRNDLQLIEQEGFERPVRFDPKLVGDTALEDVLTDFLDEQLTLIETELGEGYAGVPLDILLTLVTDDGTKKAIDTQVLTELVQRKHKITATEVDACLQRFEQIRILNLSS